MFALRAVGGVHAQPMTFVPCIGLSLACASQVEASAVVRKAGNVILEAGMKSAKDVQVSSFILASEASKSRAAMDKQ